MLKQLDVGNVRALPGHSEIAPQFPTAILETCCLSPLQQHPLADHTDPLVLRPSDVEQSQVPVQDHWAPNLV
eukprot:3079933-Prorocentrum_lima.AAC.1